MQQPEENAILPNNNDAVVEQIANRSKHNTTNEWEVLFLSYFFFFFFFASFECIFIYIHKQNYETECTKCNPPRIPVFTTPPCAHAVTTVTTGRKILRAYLLNCALLVIGGPACGVCCWQTLFLQCLSPLNLQIAFGSS